MYKLLSELLSKRNIDLFSHLSLRDCKIKRQYLLDRVGISDGTVFVIAVPYLSRSAFSAERNVSLYAVARDYHLFFKELFDEVLAELRAHFPDNKFAAFADHSPINEVDAALRSGLGILGKHGMLITEKYSSFVFLGEIITDMRIPASSSPIRTCEDCGACSAACPGTFCESGGCVSSLTQKKGEAGVTLAKAIERSRSVWGCDACALACPHTKKAIKDGTIFTSIGFFNTDTLPFLTAEKITDMTDGEFSARAYSWRGKITLLRNLGIFEKNCNQE